MQATPEPSETRSIDFLVDFVLPELTPYEFAIYVLLLRLETTGPIRIGKRTIASRLGKGVRAKVTNFQHITDMLNSLEAKGFINIADTNREGTRYEVVSLQKVTVIAAKLIPPASIVQIPDYFNDPIKRLEIFERDRWTCHYCGRRLTAENASLDHLQARSKGGGHSDSNLVACCLECNSIKSGRTYEEAAPDLLRKISSNARKQQ